VPIFLFRKLRLREHEQLPREPIANRERPWILLLGPHRNHTIPNKSFCPYKKAFILNWGESSMFRCGW
jgi:hypothetical protein